MPNVVFVAPYLAETTLRFVSAVALLPGVRAAIVTQESSDKLPPNLQEHLAAHLRVDDSLDPVQIAQAVEALSGQMGPVHRIVGALEQLQVPLGQVRDAFGIPGMGAEAARNFRDKSRMKTILRAAGIGCARHALASSAGDAQESARAIGFPLVAKPPAGAGAKATHRVESDDELARYLAAHPPSADHPLLLEEFLHGTEHSLETVSIAGRPVWHS
ncbi:MAG: hypothetical protein OEQ13_11860, partial [Acidobacteriota bacterium]|nr:hypothetical protein [Acidobacteriota bacterium]